MENYYQTLGVSQTATTEEIRGRYRFLALAYHPDRFSDEVTRTQAEDEMTKVNLAYAILSHPDKRKIYDGEMAAEERQLQAQPVYEPYYPVPDDFPNVDAVEAEAAVPEPLEACGFCGHPIPRRKMKFSEEVGAFFFHLTHRVDGSVCPTCAMRAFWDLTMAGAAGLLCLALVAGGLAALLRPRASFRSAQKPTISPVFVSAQKQQPNPTAIPQDQAAALGASENCVLWKNVSSGDVGKTVCVKGTVSQAGFTGQTFLMSFSDKNQDLHLLARDGYYYEDIAGKCVMANGMVQMSGEMPYIDVGTNLMKCR
jgi:hypothetical protein